MNVLTNAEYPVPLSCGMLYYLEGITDTTVLAQPFIHNAISNLLNDLEPLLPQPNRSPDIRIQTDGFTPAYWGEFAGEPKI